MSHTFFHLCSPFHIMPQALKRRFTKASSEFSEIKLDSASLNEWSNCFHSDTQVRSTGRLHSAGGGSTDIESLGLIAPGSSTN